MSESPKAVFLSYSSQDAEAARRLCDSLRAAGIEVWFDQSELRGGDAWDASIRRKIKECALFVPVISANTEARSEGYFRLEWKLGADRSHLMADDQAFLLPVVVDDTPEATARVPDRFRERQWSRVVDAPSAASFATRANEILAGTGAPPPRVEKKEATKTEERRVVTVLFSDIAGSTGMDEPDDPEDMRALLGRYYALAREVVAAHGGTLEKVMGDSVMAVFGIPQAHGDDAERALAAALALLDAVARDPQTATLAPSLGVNTGEVVTARNPDTGTFIVSGEAVNIAARLQQQADPGTILVGERTRRAVSTFRFGEEQEIAVKGKREPIRAATLVERLAGRRTARAAFLGREHDLAQLDLVARRAFTERRPQLVTITAPAGTGKSRLVEEFAARIKGGAKVVTAQCLPYGSAVTFLPLKGLVREMLGVESEGDILAGLQRTFAEAGHSDGDASRLAALIGVTLGDETESERRDRDELFTAWRLLVEAQAARGPLVVVFEDLHWATDTLLDLVENVTVSRNPTPLVMFALARPELLDRKRNWGGGRRNFTSLGLEPLSDEETHGLVASLTEGVPRATAQRIVERSGGNPFFAGELVRAYAERRREGARDAEIQLPDTVHATVLARIDKLPPGERSILELAAVAGRTARASAIQALASGLGEARILQSLAALAEQDFLVAQGADGYAFRHIVIREVAYATLPRSERVRAHLRLAQWFEDTSPARANELAEVVAYHYRQAISLSPGARVPEGLPAAKVVAALERAARAAANAAAFMEAAEQLRETIRIAPPEDRLRLLELSGDLLLFGDDAIRGFAEAYERWRASPDADPGVGARLLVKRLMVAARWSGSLAKPIQTEEFNGLAVEARRLLDRSPDEMLEAKLACALAFERTRFTLADGRAAELLRGTSQAAELFASRGDIEAESEALDALAAVQRSAPPTRQDAIATTQRRLANLSRLSLLERVDAWSVLIWDLVYAGRYEEAIRMLGEARRSQRAGEPERVLAHATAWACLAAMLCGRWDEALALGDALLAMREESPVTQGRFTFPGWVAALRVASARLDTTRIARYRSAFIAIADVGLLSETQRSLWDAFIERDAQAGRRFLAGSTASPDRRGEVIALLLFELGEPMVEEELAALEQRFGKSPALLALRIQLARALNGDAQALRRAIAALDDAGLVADAARASALLALRTRAADDRAEAERRLGALGDRAYLQRLAEEWSPQADA